MIPRELISIEGHGPTQWMRDRLLRDSADTMGTVGAWIPTGFAAYCRIFHPAHRYISSEGVHQVIRWSEIAAANGKVAHPLMQWHKLLGLPSLRRSKGPEGGTAPCIGYLDPAEVGSVVEVLTRFTETPGHCYFGAWYGGVHWRPENPSVEIGAYEYFVFQGGLHEVPKVPADTELNFWWPADRAWCLYTDTDSLFTLVGGSAECIASLLSHPALEALPVAVGDPIHVDGDAINPCAGE